MGEIPTILVSPHFLHYPHLRVKDGQQAIVWPRKSTERHHQAEPPILSRLDKNKASESQLSFRKPGSAIIPSSLTRQTLLNHALPKIPVERLNPYSKKWTRSCYNKGTFTFWPSHDLGVPNVLIIIFLLLCVCVCVSLWYRYMWM